jgi:putative acetyltransferase
MIFNISPLSAKDYPQILLVWEASVRESHHFLTESDIQRYKAMIPDEYLSKAALFGLYPESGGLAAFIGITGDRIEMLFVHPANFKKGIGSVLCQFAIQELRASKVDVNEDNQGAFKFYTKMGLQVTGQSDSGGDPFPVLHLRRNENE